MTDDLTSQGIAALNTGDKARARQLLQAAVARTPDDETAWIWLSGTIDTDNERAQCLRRVLEINPNNTIAQMGLASLETRNIPQPVELQKPTTGSVETRQDIASDGGYIYVLINPSMVGLVKVGKTARDPEARARELSAATGVPTTFYLAYKAFFQNCSRAEQYIHTRLEQMNYRVTKSREFFSAPLDEIIEIIQQARGLDEQSAETRRDTPNITARDGGPTDAQTLPSDEPWRGIYEMAEAYLYGTGDTLQDYTAAMKLYKQAAILGCDYAFLRMGFLYARGLGCKKDAQKALDCFKEGIHRGDSRCWAEMAELYFNTPHFENSEKCWNNYFDSVHFKENVPQDNFNWGRSAYACKYIVEALIRGTGRGIKESEIRIDHRDKLASIKPELVETCNRNIQQCQKIGDLSSKHWWTSVLTVIQTLGGQDTQQAVLPQPSQAVLPKPSRFKSALARLLR